MLATCVGRVQGIEVAAVDGRRGGCDAGGATVGGNAASRAVLPACGPLP